MVEGRYDYELSDHLGNVRAVISGIKVNAQADVLEYADYYAMGGVARSGGTMQYRYGYQGQYAEKDGETGWNSFELRQYDAVIGRWLSPDPYGQYNSPYVAMGNDWVNMVDPDGGWTDPIISATTNLVGTATDMTKIILEFKEVVITATRIAGPAAATMSGAGRAASDFVAGFTNAQLSNSLSLAFTDISLYRRETAYISRAHNLGMGPWVTRSRPRRACTSRWPGPRYSLAGRRARPFWRYPRWARSPCRAWPFQSRAG